MIKTILNLLLFWRRPAEKSQILIEPRRRAILSFGVQPESQEEENYPSMRFNRVGDCSVWLGNEIEHRQMEVREEVGSFREKLKDMGNFHEKEDWSEFDPGEDKEEMNL